MKLNSLDDSDITKTKETTSKKKSNKIKRKYEDISTGGPRSKKRNTNNLYQPPSVEELNNLRETENLFNNNLFRLQIEEILSETKIKEKRKHKLSNWLSVFKSCIEKLPAHEVTLSELLNLKLKKKDKILEKLVKYENLFKTDQDLALKFVKPEETQCFGLFENGCLPGPNISISINLTMPKSCFLLKDYLNNRYVVKRYYYLLFIAEHLKKHDMASNLKISFYENNHLLPIIELTPIDTDKTTILIFVTPAEGTFKATRFLPEQNNCKIDLFDSNLNVEVLKNTPTIFYNSLLAHDVTLYSNNEFLKNILKDQSNVQDGVKLLCIWLKQRELNVGIGSFTERMVLYLVAWLLHKKKISKFMSSYQIIRNFWNFLISSDLINEPMHIGETMPDVLKQFKDTYGVVILDKTGCYNVASFLDEEIFNKVKFESQVALKYLDNNRNNSFQELFLTSYPFHLQYDIVIDLKDSERLNKPFDISDKDKCLYVGYNDLLIYNFVYKMIKRGLNKRVFNIVPRIVEKESFLFGINLNPDEAFNPLEKGPALNSLDEAALYREFWGQLASDRRFKDGSTNVSVYFKTNTIKAKRNIVKKVIQFVMEEKLHLKCYIHYNDFEEVLLFKRVVPSYPNGTNEETCLKIILAADELAKKLRELNMSLKITGVQGVSDVFSYSEVFPPIPSNFKVSSNVTAVRGNNLVFKTDKKVGLVPRFVQPIESVLQLEYSSKWPNDLEALRHIKTSFYLKISELLSENHLLLTYPCRDFIDIFFEGVVFRYRMFVPKEVVLLKKQQSEIGLISFRESEESLNLENSLNVLPKVMGALRGVQSLHPSYGPGTCLVKRWLRTHLIDEHHISDVVVDLLNASLYLNHTSKSNTPQISFLRFLKFVSEIDWNLQIVLVNFNNDLSAEEIADVESRIQNNRSAFPNLFILTPYDDFSSTFTKHSPSKEILNRIKQLALESLNFVTGTIVDRRAVDIKDLFIPNFEGYDVLIELKPLVNPKRHEEITFSSVDNRIVIEKYQHSNEDKIPIVNFDPVKEYLNTLRRNYGKFAVFFHDSYGGSVIGVLWRPRVFEKLDFKVSSVNGGKIVNKKVVFNVDAVIEDFFIIGKDLVKNIERINKNKNV